MLQVVTVLIRYKGDRVQSTAENTSVLEGLFVDVLALIIVNYMFQMKTAVMHL